MDDWVDDWSNNAEDAINAFGKQGKIDDIKERCDALEASLRTAYTAFKRTGHSNTEILFKLLKLNRGMEDALFDIEERLQAVLDKGGLGDLE
jgi:hypothetical protein